MPLRVIESLRKREKTKVDKAPRKKGFSFSFFSRISQKDLAVFTRQLATLVNTGVPILESLSILEEQTEKEKMREVVGRLRREVESGRTLAEAMRRQKGVFGNLIENMVEVGETGGVLGATLNRVSEYLEKSNALRRKIKSAMAYPMVVLVVTLLLTFLLVAFLIPTFAKLYESAGVALPLPTKVVINLSYLLRRYLLFFFLLPFLFFYGIRVLRKKDRSRQALDKVMIRFPLFGTLLLKVAVAKFTRTLSTLIKSGVSILDSLEITARTVGNSVVERAVLQSRRMIGEGKTLSKPLKESGIFPPIVVNLISVGEETGKLSEMLEKVADFYEEEVDTTVAGLSTVIEPLMLVFVGMVVGAIMLSLYLPIFNLASTIR